MAVSGALRPFGLRPAGSSPERYESPNSLSAQTGQNVSASPSWAR
jgi:hypothetical protein